MNSLGAHFNPVSISIVNLESKTSLDWSYTATCQCAGLYAIYKTARLCGNETCGVCAQITEQIDAKNGTFKNLLASDDARRLVFPLDTPPSDNPIHFFSWAKEKFGEIWS